MLRILITGANGQLGNSLKKEFEGDPEINAIFTDIEDLDITNQQEVDRFIGTRSFDYLINCAAYTAVDKAETDELKAASINTGAVGYLANAAANRNVKVIHISTDYVFPGDTFRPYKENDEPAPQSIYGRTKLEGEGILTSFCRDALIIRTSWLYSEYGANFVKNMLAKAETGEPLRVVDDQIGTPTYAADLARAIHTILLHDEWKPGIYHFSNEGVASWYDFARMIFFLSGKKVDLTPVSTSAYPTPAKRPLFSVLSKEKIKKNFNVKIPHWMESLQICINNLQQ